MTVRKIEESEIVEIIDLEKECFASNYYGISSILEMYENSRYEFFGIFSRNQIVGYLILLDSIDIYEIIKVGITDNYRGRGLAKKLIEESLKEIEVNLMLEVRESNESARKLYEKIGFVQIGKRKGYYADTKEDALILLLENQQ